MKIILTKRDEILGFNTRLYECRQVIWASPTHYWIHHDQKKKKNHRAIYVRLDTWQLDPLSLNSYYIWPLFKLEPHIFNLLIINILCIWYIDIYCVGFIIHICLRSDGGDSSQFRAIRTINPMDHIINFTSYRMPVFYLYFNVFIYDISSS